MKEENNLILGIDDSGRGPVIGPMVLAGCLIDENTEKHFKEIGVKDSKMLTPRKRRILAREIKIRSKYHITLTNPYEIDGRNHVGLNLNKIEAIKSAEIINKLVRKVNKEEKDEIRVVIDCPSPNRESWKNYLMRYVKDKNLNISCEHKADRNHISCSAASILAKTTRDREIMKLKKKIGKDFGSGYSSDPITIDFLKKYFSTHRKDGIFRETWQTIANHKKEMWQKKLGEF